MSRQNTLRFLSEQQVREIAEKRGTPVYVYSKSVIKRQINELKKFNNSSGLTIRYAMKANSNADVLKFIQQQGLFFDASSIYEADTAMKAGVDPKKIGILGQEIPDSIADYIEKGIDVTATSLHQIEQIGKNAPGSSIRVRINTPIGGDGMNNRLTTAGFAASFGIWYEDIQTAKDIAKKYNLTINGLHTHMGSGAGSAADPKTWKEIIDRNLNLIQLFPDVKMTSIGGGFKVAYVKGESESNIEEVSEVVNAEIVKFREETGRSLKLEIEPGKYIVAAAGTLIMSVIDKKNTGTEGFNFFVVNSGMNDFLRSSMYGAQHPFTLVPKKYGNKYKTKNFIVAGHCCESGDTFTTAEHDPESVKPVALIDGKIGDYICMDMAGAYCASMRAVGYNSFPVAKEILIE